MRADYTINLGLAPTVGPVSGLTFYRERQFFTQAPQWYMIILPRFAGEISVNGRSQTFAPDSLLMMPPRALVQIQRTGPEGDVYLLNFSPHPEADSPLGFSMVQPYDREMTVVDMWLRTAIDRIAFNKATVNNLIWTILLQAGVELSEWQEHSALGRMRRFVDQSLGQAFSMTELAEATGVSQNHLIRLCRAELGVTPQQYVREARMSRASELLMSSPASIKEVAHLVGVPDLQRFNKLVRETFGVSPRQLRNERSTPDPMRRYSRERQMQDQRQQAGSKAESLANKEN